MTKIPEMPAVGRKFISNLTMPVFENPTWTPTVPAKQRRVSIVSTAAVSRAVTSHSLGLQKIIGCFIRQTATLL